MLISALYGSKEKMNKNKNKMINNKVSRHLLCDNVSTRGNKKIHDMLNKGGVNE